MADIIRVGAIANELCRRCELYETQRKDSQQDVNSDYNVWDLIPRNVLRDNDGDIYVVDAEIKRIKGTDSI